MTRDGQAFLAFAKHDELLAIGPDPGMKLVKVEAKPRYGSYYLHITYEDGLTRPEVPKHPVRILGIDPGLDNFAAVTNNIGLEPFIIDGKERGSMNQWFNKAKAEAVSKLTAGHDPKDRSVRRASRRTMRLSERRDNRIRDWFFRIGHYIMRYAKAHRAEVIVIGHNQGQKQGIAIGKRNNQNFVGIPYGRFISTMEFLSRVYGVPVVMREESYTSKASLLDADPIPVYGDGDGQFSFSGQRIRRGLYRSGKGTLINADINGAGNIIRKEYPYAFQGQDLAYLARTVRRITLREILGVAKKQPDRNKRGFNRKSKASKTRGHAKRKQRMEAMAAKMNAAAQGNTAA